MHFWNLEFTNGTQVTWRCRGCDQRIIVDDSDRLEPVKPGTPPTMYELSREDIERSCPRTAKAPTSAVFKPTTHLVIIVREGSPEVTPFSNYEEAERYYRMASDNWTESYFAVVVAGPDKPLPEVKDPHCMPDVVARRRERFATTCADDNCDLSGGYAHIGPCEPCKCPMRHAIEECPHTPV